MTAAKIAEELRALEVKTATCAKQLRELYQRYLAELSNAASQQLMLVCYHLCTESYPEAFVGLSSGDRQTLQCHVREQGEKLRQQLSLEGLLQPDVGDLEDNQTPRIAVIKAELTGDDLEVLTSALEEESSDRILALLKEKEIDLPFDLEAAMQQRFKPNAKDASERDAPDEDAAEKDGGPSDGKRHRSEQAAQANPTEEPALKEEPGPQDDGPKVTSSVEDSTSLGPSPAVAPAADGVEANPVEANPSETSDEVNESEEVKSEEMEQSVVADDAVEPPRGSEAVAETINPAASGGRSLGRRFLEDILSRRTLDRRKGIEDEIAGVAGQGSLRIEDEIPAEPKDVHEPKDDQASTMEPVEEAEELALEAILDEDSLDGNRLDESNAFDDNNGFDPDFEPPPAEDRYEPVPLKSSDKLDISPGVLASALAAEGDDDRRGMLMRPMPYDGSTELSQEALRDPFALIRWVERMERGISQRLRQSSQRMTRRLEKSGVLNNELPDGLLEAAVRPDGDHEDDSDGTMPHVLRLKLNAAGKEGRPRKGKSIRIVAIYLRLSEIEFETPGVMAWRNQLRNQVKLLRQLSKDYKDCKHAQDVVQAQDLWRRGWND